MLNDSKIRSVKSLQKSYKLTDSQGLYLLVTTSGSRLWYFRYRFEGKENRLAFGTYPQVTLAEAREKRDATRKLLSGGISPSQIRKSLFAGLMNPVHLNSQKVMLIKSSPACTGMSFLISVRWISTELKPAIWHN